MSAVVPLHADDCDEKIVHLLEDMLRDAKAGRIQAIGYAVVGKGSLCNWGWRGTPSYTFAGVTNALAAAAARVMDEEI